MSKQEDIPELVASALASEKAALGGKLDEILALLRAMDTRERALPAGGPLPAPASSRAALRARGGRGVMMAREVRVTRAQGTPGGLVPHQAWGGPTVPGSWIGPVAVAIGAIGEAVGVTAAPVTMETLAPGVAITERGPVVAHAALLAAAEPRVTYEPAEPETRADAKRDRHVH